MAVRIQFRRGTTTQWNDTNPILASGEVGFNTTLNQFKIGNGDTRWIDLPYSATGTITGVVAGTGLTGGGTSGSVTLSLASNVLTTDYVSAKGDLITATADNSPTILSVGATDGDVLQVSSAQSTGLTYGKVQTAAIADNAVTEIKILDTSISTNKLADNAVTAGKLATNAVTATKIASNAVTELKIADGSVSTTKIANNAVGTNQIADLAVTGSKFADNTITSAKIANNTILNEDINEFANISFSKLQTGTLPSTITVGTSNYADGSVSISKLNNTVGPQGVGVWQDWTPTVVGITGSQWLPRYCKYMQINNFCVVYAIIELQALTMASSRRIKISLPIAPAFVSALPSGAAVAVGDFVHWGQNQATKEDTSYYAVYKNGYVEHWRHGGEDGLNVTGTGGILSVYATYPVIAPTP